MDIAGRDVTRYLRLLLRKEGSDFHRSSEFEIVREIKEKMCYVTCNVMKDEGTESEKVAFCYLFSVFTLFLVISVLFFDFLCSEVFNCFIYSLYEDYAVLFYVYIIL